MAWMNWTDRALQGLVGVVVVALVAGGLWLRLFCLETVPLLTSDEAYYGLQTWRLLHGEPFELRTTSGNLLSPLFVITQAPILAWKGPTIWAVRLPAALAGLAAVALAYRLGRRMMGVEGGLLASVGLMSLPAAVQFSRYGCEFSQTPLVGLVAASLAWSARAGCFWGWVGFGVLVHPTNILLIPLFLPLLAVRAAMAGPRALRGAAMRSVAGALCIVPAFSWWILGNPNVGSHAGDPRALGAFIDSFGRFVTFTNLGETDEAALSRHAWWFRLSVGGLLVAGTVALARRRRWDLLAMVVGGLLGLIAFDLAAGAKVLSSAVMRYGAVLIAPTVLVAASLVVALFPAGSAPRVRRSRWASLAAVMALGGWASLWSTAEHGIRPLLGEHPGRWTQFRSQDPYSEAAQVIRRDLRNRGEQGGPTIVAQDVFVNGLQYEYLMANTDVRVDPMFTLFEVWVMRQRPDGGAPEVEARLSRMLQVLEAGGYAVAESGSLRERGGGMIAEAIASRHEPARVRRWEVEGQEVYRLEPPPHRIADGSSNEARR
jgi:4-amino-4-deoxy-L-arabinose transferase-like glycosyltransferase